MKFTEKYKDEIDIAKAIGLYIAVAAGVTWAGSCIKSLPYKAIVEQHDKRMQPQQQLPNGLELRVVDDTTILLEGKNRNHTLYVPRDTAYIK